MPPAFWENIVKPLKDEFCETKKELGRNTREMARLRKAIDTAGTVLIVTIALCLTGCASHRKSMTAGSPDGNGKRRQRERKPTGGTGDGGDTGECGEADDTGGQPP